MRISWTNWQEFFNFWSMVFSQRSTLTEDLFSNAKNSQYSKVFRFYIKILTEFGLKIPDRLTSTPQLVSPSSLEIIWFIGNSFTFSVDKFSADNNKLKSKPNTNTNFYLASWLMNVNNKLVCVEQMLTIFFFLL